MQAENRLLVNIFDPDKPHGWARDRLADGFRIRRIVLVAFDVRLYELRPQLGAPGLPFQSGKAQGSKN